MGGEGGGAGHHVYEQPGPYTVAKACFSNVRIPDCGKYGSVTVEAYVPKPLNPCQSVPHPEPPRKVLERAEVELAEEQRGNPGGFPIFTFATGYALQPCLYSSYGERLASHGYLALVWGPAVEEPVSLHWPFVAIGPTHKERGLLNKGLIDWAVQASQDVKSPLCGAVESGVPRVLAAGHSLGGKTAALAAAYDSRIRGLVGVAPVDECRRGPEDDPSSVELLRNLTLPGAFLGCDPGNAYKTFLGMKQWVEPPDSNYEKFYDACSSKLAWKLMVKGSGHLAFKDKPANFLFENVCKKGTVSYEEAGRVTKTVLVAMAEHSIRGADILKEYLEGWSFENAGEVVSSYKQGGCEVYPMPPLEVASRFTPQIGEDRLVPASGLEPVYLAA